MNRQNPEAKQFNILHVVSQLPVGGVENMLLKVISGYDRKRFRASVCCLRTGGEIADKLRRRGYEVVVLNKMKGHGFDIGAVADLYRLIKKKNIHILRTHQYHANLYGRIAGILAGVPVMIPSFHNLYISPHRPKMHRRVFNCLLGLFTDVMVGVSEAVSSDIIRYDWIPRKKVRTIYNGILLEDYQEKLSKIEARKRLGISGSGVIVGTVGRLTDQKGHKFLIEAIAKINDVRLVIAGDGPLRHDLERLAEKIKDRCLFLGTISPEKIPIFLKSLDIFCFPSLWEGLPVALIEALAAGLPVVATDIPPIREVLTGAGILVPIGDTDALAQALKQLLDDSALMADLRSKAIKRAEIFSIENTVKSYEELFIQGLKRKGLFHEI